MKGLPAFLSLTMHHVALHKVFIFLDAAWSDAQVCPDVIFSVPGLIFIVHHEEESKFHVHVVPLPVGPLTAAQSPRPAHHQGPDEATVKILVTNKPGSRFRTEESTEDRKFGLCLFLMFNPRIIFFFYFDKVDVGVVAVRDAVWIRGPWTRTGWNVPGQLKDLTLAKENRNKKT